MTDRKALCFFLAGWLAGPPVAVAHPQYSPSLNNRYLKVSLVGGGTVRVAYAVMLGEGPATAVRRGADTNGDGTLDEAEVRAFAERTARGVAEGLAVDVDGARRAVEWEAPVVSLSDPRVGPLPFSVDLIGKVRVPGRGPHTLGFDDTTPLDSLGETEIRFEEGPGVRVLRAWHARDDGGRTMRYVWNGPKYSGLENRAVGLTFVDESIGDARATFAIAVEAAAMLLVLVGLGVGYLRVRKRPAKPR